MNKIKKGSVVVKKNDCQKIMFRVEKIKRSKGKKIVILKGLLVRIIEQAYLEELVLVDKRHVSNYIEESNRKLEKKIYSRKIVYNSINVRNGRIVHIDGDKRYMEKSYRYYKKLGLNAVVKYVPEEKQEYYVTEILSKYNPDILVITGHDGMIKKGKNFSDIYNYMNSRYFVNTVKKARKHKCGRNLVIFAGACQSYFEALIDAGANFASSPARVLIDFADPLIVAEKIATTDKKYFITINDIADELRDGKDGIGGIGARGKQETITTV